MKRGISFEEIVLYFALQLAVRIFIVPPPSLTTPLQALKNFAIIDKLAAPAAAITAEIYELCALLA